LARTALPKKSQLNKPDAIGLMPGVALLFLSLAGERAMAGPPLAIGDPGVLDPGRWEVITAVTASSIGEGHFYEAPLLDVSVGLIQDRLQVSATYPFGHADPEGDDDNWEFGNLELGATWRFWENEKLQLALAPSYSFGVTRRTAEQGIGDFGDVAALPLVAEYQVSETWRLNTSVGYESVEDDEDVWVYGAAVAYIPNQKLELLLELAGGTDEDFDEDLLDIRTGFDYAVSDSFHLLFSVATGVRKPGGEEELDYSIFAGLQFFF
jgi:outer membrane receptor protein involved in Fe transport